MFLSILSVFGAILVIVLALIGLATLVIGAFMAFSPCSCKPLPIKKDKEIKAKNKKVKKEKSISNIEMKVKKGKKLGKKPGKKIKKVA